MSQTTTVSSSDGQVKKRKKTGGMNQIVHPSKLSADVIRERITEIYEEQDPTKIDEVDMLMEKYKGSEIDLYRAVRAKYPMRRPSENGDMTKIAFGFFTVVVVFTIYAYIFGVKENFSLRSLAPPMPFG